MILVTFHKLAAIAETLDFGVRSENDLSLTQGEALSRSDSIDKCKEIYFKSATLNVLVNFKKEEEKSKNILTLLELYNQEEEKDDENKRKVSFKHNDSDSEDETPLKKVPRVQKDTAIFEKHINSFCTVYLDFDQHSDEVMSYLVRIFLII